MKKSYVLTLAGIIGMAAMTISFFRFKDVLNFQTTHYVIFCIILGIMAVSTFYYAKNAKDEKIGVPAEDELTERLRQKSAYDTLPYTISIWAIILALNFNSIQTVKSIGIGIISMAVVYVVFLLLNKSKGLQ